MTRSVRWKQFVILQKRPCLLQCSNCKESRKLSCRLPQVRARRTNGEFDKCQQKLLGRRRVTHFPMFFMLLGMWSIWRQQGRPTNCKIISNFQKPPMKRRTGGLFVLVIAFFLSLPLTRKTNVVIMNYEIPLKEIR